LLYSRSDWSSDVCSSDLYRNTMAIEEGQGLPALDQTQWSTQIRFIVRREAIP
jgi:hypothetical protein